MVVKTVISILSSDICSSSNADLERLSYENMASPNNVPLRADLNLSIVEQETTEV
jgi:hypothetical protein